MTTRTCRKSTRRDPMQWNKNERFAEDFAVSRTQGFERDDHPRDFGTSDNDTFMFSGEQNPEFRGSEYRLELIREIAARVQRNGSLKL